MTNRVQIVEKGSFEVYTGLLEDYGFLLLPFKRNIEQLEDVLWTAVANPTYLAGCVMTWNISSTNGNMEAIELSSRDLLFSISPRTCQTSVQTIKATEQGKKLLSLFGATDLEPIRICREVQTGDLLPREHSILIGDVLRMFPVRVKKKDFLTHPAEGLWIANYSVHGPEILKFSIQTGTEIQNQTLDNTLSVTVPGTASYSTLLELSPIQEPGDILVAHKLTGDVNIAADTDSFVVVLGMEMSTNPQPFLEVVPLGIAEDIDLSQLVLSVSYFGYGRVAGTQMQDAQWIPIYFCMFENLPAICVCWPLMGFHCMFFHRIDSLSYEENKTE